MSEEKALKARERFDLSLRSSMPAYLVIGAGLTLLAANLLGIHLIDFLWPGFVMLPGLLMLWPAMNNSAESHSRLSFLAIPGAMFLTVGALLFIMNVSDRFEAWAYSWPLVLAAGAAGWMYAWRFRDGEVEERGRRFIRWMAGLFAVLAVFFELLVFENLNIWLPLALVGYGIYMLRQRRRVEVV